MTKKFTEEDFWEEGAIGLDEDSVGVVKEAEEKNVDDAMNLQMISIRLNKSLLADLKELAGLYKTGYQPLTREVLARFVAGEKKRIYNSYLADKMREERSNAESADATESLPDQKKTA